MRSIAVDFEKASTVTKHQPVVCADSATVAASEQGGADRIVEFQIHDVKKFDVTETAASSSNIKITGPQRCGFDYISKLQNGGHVRSTTGSF